MVILVGVTSVGVAGSGEQLSVAACTMTLEKLYENEDFNTLFNRSLTRAFVDSGGDVSIYFESKIPRHMLIQIEDTMITFLCDTWTNFNKLHSMVSTAGLYVSIWDGDDCVYMTSGKIVVDFYGNPIPFIHSNKI